MIMLLLIFLALFLPCTGLSLVFLVYIILVWFGATSNSVNENRLPEKSAAKKGLSAAEVEKLPRMTGKDLMMGNECAVCLDDIGDEEPVRILPGCNHGFHIQCADTWLSSNPVCPVCKRKLNPELFEDTENSPC